MTKKRSSERFFYGESINHGERRENTPEPFGRAHREGGKENTEMLFEQRRFVSDSRAFRLRSTTLNVQISSRD